jgi:PAS domain S-box-containing protein
MAPDISHAEDAWLVGGGAMGALMRAHDWPGTPLGPTKAWPQSLKAAVGIMLSTRHPVFIFWGSEHICLYNDAYSASLGPEKHPSILGSPGRQAWPDAWSVIGPQISQVMAGGEPTWHENQLVPIIRHGRREDVYWTYSYGPIIDAGAPNSVGGVLVLCTETTQAVVSARTGEERFRALAEASSQVFYRMSPDWSEMRQLSGGGFLADTQEPSRDWMEKYIHPDDQPYSQAVIQEAIRTKTTFDLEHRVRQVDGALGWTHSRAVPILGANGEITEWFGVASDVTARKQAEEAVRRSEERLRSAFAIQTVGIMFWGPGFRLTEVNDAFLNMTGFSREEAIGLTWRDLTPEEFHPASLKAVEEVTGLGESTPYEKQYFRKDGSCWWGLFAARKVGNEVVEFALDVTQRKLAEAALRETEQRFRLVVENARDYAILITDERDRITDWFPGATNVFGWSAEEVVGQPSDILFTPEDREEDVPEWEVDTARREGAAPNVRWHLRKDGQRVFIEGQTVALHHPDGSLRGFLKIGQDVTARHDAEDALRESERRFRTLAESISDVFYMTDLDRGTLMYLSPAYDKVWGRSAADLQADLASFIDTIHPDDHAKFLSGKKAQEQGEPIVVEYRIVRPDGSIRWIFDRSFLIPGAFGRQAAGVASDITERKQAEAALRTAHNEAEKASQAKSRFLAAASHDLRQPVTAASLYMDLLQRRLQDPEHQSLANLVRTSLDGLLGLLNGLLEIARLDAGIVRPDVQTVVLDDMLGRLSAEFEAQAGAAGLWLNAPRSKACVSTDPLLLELILRNLIGNALKYTRRGGVSVEALEEDAAIRIDVRDTGPGIPGDLLDRIFEDFYQAGEPAGQTRGFGIGLATVRRAAQALNCRLKVESEPGQGSVFSVWLPRSQEATPRKPAPAMRPTTSTKDLSGHTILMVEDDLLIGMALAMELEEIGISVVEANSVASARARLDEQTTPIDLVLTDYQLGDGNGLEVIEAIRKRWRVPAILLTGNTAPAILQQAQKKAIRLIHKPVPDRALQRAVAELLTDDGDEQ